MHEENIDLIHDGKNSLNENNNWSKNCEHDNNNSINEFDVQTSMNWKEHLNAVNVLKNFHQNILEITKLSNNYIILIYGRKFRTFLVETKYILIIPILGTHAVRSNIRSCILSCAMDCGHPQADEDGVRV